MKKKMKKWADGRTAHTLTSISCNNSKLMPYATRDGTICTEFDDDDDEASEDWICPKKLTFFCW